MFLANAEPLLISHVTENGTKDTVSKRFSLWFQFHRRDYCRRTSRCTLSTYEKQIINLYLFEPFEEILSSPVHGSWVSTKPSYSWVQRMIYRLTQTYCKWRLFASPVWYWPSIEVLNILTKVHVEGLTYDHVPKKFLQTLKMHFAMKKQKSATTNTTRPLSNNQFKSLNNNIFFLTACFSSQRYLHKKSTNLKT